MLLPLGIAKGLLLLLMGDTVDGLVSLLIMDEEMVEFFLCWGEEEEGKRRLVRLFLIDLSPIFLSSCGVSYRPTFLVVEFLDIQNAIFI
jgi:hypothetical protein